MWPNPQKTALVTLTEGTLKGKLYFLYSGDGALLWKWFNAWAMVTILSKSSIINIWQDSKHSSDIYNSSDQPVISSKKRSVLDPVKHLWWSLYFLNFYLTNFCKMFKNFKKVDHMCVTVFTVYTKRSGRF